MEKLNQKILALLLIAPQFGLAQTKYLSQPFAQTGMSQTSNPPPPPPPKKFKVLLSAFKPWNSGGKVRETNMAGFVADALVDMARSQYPQRIDILDKVELEVLYDTAPEALIQHILGMNEAPDLILSLGQGGAISKAPLVTIESGTRQVVSSLLDGSGKGRRGDEFKGFERELGFSFPVQDMFCSLSKNDRKKVTASYTPGSFVCNDISYYMENFSRGLRYSQSTLDRLENANESSKSDQLRRLSLRFEEDLKAEEARLLSLKDQKTQAYQKYLLDLQELRARNERRTMAGAPLAELEKEPVFYFNDGDATQSIKRDYDYKLRNVENEFLREQNRIQRFRSLFSLENPIPFVFIHVPVSDGVIHPPVFKLEDAKCLSKSESLPYSSNWQWMEVQEASTRLEESSSSLRSEAADIIRRKLKMAAKATAPGAVPGTPDVGSGRMAECQKDYSREKEVSHTYYDEKAKKEVTVYRSVVAPSRFVYALSSWESKAELKEESERNQYARLILQMVQGAFTARQINARDFPLPTLGKRKYFPRGKENLTKAIKDIERLTKPSVEVQMITQGKAYDPKNMVEGFDYTLLKVPAQLSSDEAACYRSFLEKVISDQDREKDNDAS